MSKSQFCIEASSNNKYVSLAICRVFLDRFVHFFDVMVRISRVGEAHTHQFDALVVYHDRGSDDPFVDVSSVNNSSPPLLVQHNSNTVIRFFVNEEIRAFRRPAFITQAGITAQGGSV